MNESQGPLELGDKGHAGNGPSDEYVGPDFLGLYYKRSRRWTLIGWLILEVLLVLAVIFVR